MRSLELAGVFRSIWICVSLIFIFLKKDLNSGVCLNTTGHIHFGNISSDVTDDISNETTHVTSDQLFPDTDADNSSHGIVPSLRSVFKKTHFNNSTRRKKIKAFVSECFCNNTTANNSFYYSIIVSPTVGACASKCNTNSYCTLLECALNHTDNNSTSLYNITPCYSDADVQIYIILINDYDFNDNTSICDNSTVKAFRKMYIKFVNMSEEGNCNLFKKFKENNCTTKLVLVLYDYNTSSLASEKEASSVIERMLVSIDSENCTLSLATACNLYNKSDDVYVMAIVIPCCADYNSSSNIPICDYCSEDFECDTNVNVECLTNVNVSVCVNQTSLCSDDNEEVYLKNILGEFCANSSDCIDTEDSVCAYGTCQCKAGFKETNNTCKQQTIGDKCIENSECGLPFTACVNGTCMCRDEYKMLENICIERRLGDICSTDKHCSNIKLSFCNGTCTCQSKYIPNGNMTCKLRDIGDICDSSDDCNVAVDDSICINDQCTCKIGFKHINLNESLCILRTLFDSCENNYDCSEAVANSICKNDSCQCTSGFVQTDSESCTKRRVGIHPCITDLDCSDSINRTYCDSNNTCSCYMGYMSVHNGTLCKLRRLSDVCSSYDDCNIAIKNSFCNHSECKCISGYLGEFGNQSCRKRQMGDVCFTDNDCFDAVEDSLCQNGTCNCIAGYLSSLEQDLCTKRKINDICENENDCSVAVTHSICTDAVCSCVKGYDEINNGTECVKRPTSIGETCYFPSHCKHIDDKAVCGEDQCMCPAQHFVADNNLTCVKYPRKIGDRCSKHFQCVSTVRKSECGTGQICQCRTNYFTDNNGTFCRRYPAQIGDRCLTTVHCKFIPNTKCLQNVCTCTYKFEPSSDRWLCLPRERMGIPKPTNIWLGGLCNFEDETPCPQWNITNQKCSREDGRVNTRCRCKPGYANIYNQGECNEVQTYYIRLNITEELGCYPKDKDPPRCYTFTEAQYIKQYSNNNTGKFRDMKLRIQVLGLYNAFNNTSLWSRFIASEVVNMTAIPHGLQASALLHITEDYYDVMNATVFRDMLLDYLKRHNGILGESYLKIGQPYKDNIYTDDFDECLDWNGQASDCSPRAWCINTYGSYMCSCRYEYHDLSFDTSSRPGRICKPEVAKIVYSNECSDGKCETNWTWMGLSLSFLLIMLIGFLVYEIYSKKNEILKSDPTYVPVKRRIERKASSRSKHLSTSEEQNLLNSDRENYEHGSRETSLIARNVPDEPPLYTEDP